MMDSVKAVELLKQKLQEVQELKTLCWDNPAFQLWYDGSRDILEKAFGLNSVEYRRFVRSVVRSSWSGDNELNRRQYRGYLSGYEVALRSILQRFELVGMPTPEAPLTEKPKALIAHGDKSASLDKVREFLGALGVEPIVAEDMPSEGRSVGDHVEWCMNQADCAIILATKGDIDGRTGDFIPRGNILHEVGKFQERFAGKIVYLLEEGTKFPTNISEKVWERFTQDNMERAFVKIARELVAFGFIKTIRQ